MNARLLALAISLSASLGIGIELANLMAAGGSFAGSAWVLFGYFTILTNAALAVLFGLIALGWRSSDAPRLVAGAVAAILLVGVIYALLLQGLRVLAGATATADFLLHRLNPVLVALFWLLFTRKGTLSWRDPLLWALYPVFYLVYALLRGAVDGHYAYPFIDVAALGPTMMIVNALLIALCFVVAGEVLVLVDRLLGRRTPPVIRPDG